MSRRGSGEREALWSVATLGLGAWLVATGLAMGQEAKDRDRDRLIAEIKKQVEELNQKLAALERQEAPQESAAQEAQIPQEWLKALSWRSIGPAAMGGRIVAISVYEADPSTYFVATASGGLLKTENNGITFQHLFDHEATVSIGDVCVAPSDKSIIWVGTGENNPRNSVSYGDGVYKSTDGGKTWTNMGLKRSFQIGKIVIHPKDPNIVYVGALGRLYGPNEERGLFKTTDGGKTWDKILYIDDKTGVIDVKMHPNDPETLLVATYERRRDLYDVNEPVQRYGPGSGIYKTTDGGKTFKKLATGLPDCLLGRIGLDYYRKDPNIVYAIVESEKNGQGPPRPPGAGGFLGVSGEDREDKAQITVVTPGGPADKAGLRPGDIIQSFGDQEIKTYDQLAEAIRARKPGDKVKLKIFRAGQEAEIEVTIGERPRPSAEERDSPSYTDPDRPYMAMLNGQRENVQDRQGPEGWKTGGVYKSTDGGESWNRVNSLNPRPMYFSQVRVDPNDDKYVYVLGVSLYRSTDGGKTFKGDGGRGVHADQHALWIDPKDGRHMIVGTDGGFYVTYDRMENWDHLNTTAIGQFYHVAIDTRPNYKVYGGLQDNGSWGGPARSKDIIGPINEDWIRVGGGDGFKCQVDREDPDQIYWTSQNGGMGTRNLRTGQASRIRPQMPRGKRARFNWNTPFLLSHHNPKIFYAAGNYVFRSLDRGKDLRPISPEIVRTERGTATAISESPRDPNVLYVGTDDGLLWVTKDGGKEWTEISKRVGLPGPRYVATLEASRYADGRVYACFDGHRSDDDDPLVYVSEDYGQTWTSLRGNLPWGSTRCLREDIKNENLLFLGTEFGAWASLDRGRSWNKLNGTLPTVAVHEFALHPTTGEVVLATHGRSLWVLDAAPLRQMTPEVLKAKATLFKPSVAIKWRLDPSRGLTNRRFTGQNPPPGASIYFTLAQKAEKASLKILDFDGQPIRELRVSTDPGLHRATWPLTRAPSNRSGQAPAAGRGRGRSGEEGEESESSERPRAESERRGAGGPARRGGPPGGMAAAAGGPLFATGGPAVAVPAGTYRVILTVDGEEFAQSLRVEADPTAPPPEIGAEEEVEVEDLFEREEELEELWERGVQID
ncbi:MAG: PDZ domain-containing protein [Isosphaeraceae bacterium]|nr:PDZ domain-containing protein [Isosphaeraceae bacterium]